MSTVLIEAKLRAPSLRPALVERSRLVGRLADPEASIGVVVAPAGFGKSTLLAQWQAANKSPCAWLSLDEADNDPVVFWSSLVASLSRVVPGFARSLTPALNSMGGLALEALVARTLNELDALEEQVVLVVDDYHRITNSECHDALTLLLERLPWALRLIISTRSDPPLPLARLRANGRVSELRAADLSFTASESAEALNECWGLDLSAEGVSALHDRTEGWPAGLYLACLSLRGSSDPAAFIADFGGASRLVVDYLMEVVLGKQTSERAAFLLDTSVLERMCGSLCDAVTGREDSAIVLTELEHENLFLVALDDRREWFRYHHLFAQALAEELGRRASERRPVLHGRAGSWFEARGDIGQAVRHAFAAGDVDRAAALVATHWAEFVNVGRMGTVREWIETFPALVIETDGRLLLIRAWISGLQGQVDEGERALSAALRVGFVGEHPDGSGTLEESAALVRATFPWSDVGEMVSAARRAYLDQGARQSPWEAVAALDLGWALILAGDLEQAREPLSRAITVATRSEQWIAAGDGHILLAEVCVAAGDLDTAAALSRDAIELATTFGFADLPHVGHYHVVAGNIQARRGVLDEADRLISLGLNQMRDAWDPLHVANALLSLASVRQRRGAGAEARAMVAEAQSLVEACTDAGILKERISRAKRTVIPPQRRADQNTQLTERELEVLAVLATGATEREVAETLFVSHSTVHSHTKSIYLKLDCTSRGWAVARARELGLIT